MYIIIIKIIIFILITELNDIKIIYWNKMYYLLFYKII